MMIWERYKKERIEQGVEIGREEGRKELAREALEIMDKQALDKRVDAVYEFMSNVRKNGGKRE